VTDLVDPGWRRALLGAVPFMGRAAVLREPRVVVLRALLVSFVLAMVLIQWVAGFVVGDESTWSMGGTTALLLVMTMLMIGGIVWIRARYRTGKLGSTRVAAYTNRFFLQLAFGEAPTLVMFVAVLLGAPLWSCRAGGVVTLIGFVFAAPTRRDVARQDPQVIEALLGRPTA
jgi:hypothetical protein